MKTLAKLGSDVILGYRRIQLVTVNSQFNTSRFFRNWNIEQSSHLGSVTLSNPNDFRYLKNTLSGNLISFSIELWNKNTDIISIQFHTVIVRKHAFFGRILPTFLIKMCLFGHMR